MVRAVFVGEAMLELSQFGEAWQLAYGGDTLNTAIHLARAGVDVSYLTALGTDAFSHDLIARWQADGVDTSLVLADPKRTPGLYAIKCDENGERSFTYWRNDSAARQLFDCEGIQAAMDDATSADVLGFSLISLAILPQKGRDALLALAGQVRDTGGIVVFDGNYRPRLWSDAAEARHWRDRAIATANIGLPTLEDETALSGEGSAEAVLAHWRGLGCTEVVVKLGAKGAFTSDGSLIPPPQQLQPVDTSGAGDAFNAGYLAARLNKAAIDESVVAGHELAGWCVMRKGAIPAAD